MNLIAISEKFNTKEKCVKYMEKLRWNKNPVCPYCQKNNSIPVKNERHHCKSCSATFSVLVGTIFEDARLPLPKFFMLIGLMLNARKGISSMQLHRDVGITVRTSWYAAMRVRCAMIETIKDLKGVIEADESYIGGKPRHKHKIADSTAYLSNIDEEKPKRGRGADKVKVAGFVERDGRVVTKILNRLTAQNLLLMLKKYVKMDGAKFMTDEFRSYNAFDEYVTRHVIKHKDKQYVKGDIHTNTIEGYWSLVKNGLRGQYHVLSRKYLPFYLAEFSYKYNRRNLQKIQFESFMKDALSSGKCLIHHKPTRPVKTIAYPKNNKPDKANVNKFNKANKEAGKKKIKSKQKQLNKSRKSKNK